MGMRVYIKICQISDFFLDYQRSFFFHMKIFKSHKQGNKKQERSEAKAKKKKTIQWGEQC